MSPEPTKHSETGASSIKRWGTAQECSPSTRETTEAYGYLCRVGTVAHTLMAEAITKVWTRQRLDKEIGRVITQEGFTIKVDQEMVDCVAFYVYDVVFTKANQAFFEVMGRAPGRGI